MLIGKRGAAATAISTATADRIVVRGRDLAADLMGSTSFTDFYFLLATGRAPTAEQSFFLDLALVSLAEHGLTRTRFRAPSRRAFWAAARWCSARRTWRAR